MFATGMVVRESNEGEPFSSTHKLIMKLTATTTAALFITLACFVSGELSDHRKLSSCERTDIDFSEFSSGDLYPTSSTNGVSISVRPRNRNKCIDNTGVIMDSSNPVLGCGDGEGDEDMFCNNCGKGLIIGTKQSATNTCDANDCRFGGTITFEFDEPVQVMFLDMLDMDTFSQWNTTFADGSSDGEVISEGRRPDLDGATARIPVNRNNVKTLSIFFKHSGFVSKLSFRRCPNGMVHGDPHFKSWGGKKFDFHGQCDLVLMQAPLAAKGKGLDVHIRSKHIDMYSYVDRAALKLGDGIMEVGHDGATIDGCDMGSIHDPQVAGHRVTRTEEVNGEGRTLVIYRLYLTEAEWVEVKVFKLFLSIRVIGLTEDNFRYTRGILGDYYTGRTLARDGVSKIEDPEQLGLEWQVNGDDPILFRTQPDPLFPVQCRAPSADNAERHLSHGVSKAQALSACEQAGEDVDSCVFDIMATGDLDMVHVY